MQQLATAIREQIDPLVDQYDARLCTMPGYSSLPEAMRRDLERHFLGLIAESLEAGDYSPLVQYAQQRASQWDARGLNLAWFQQALTVPEELLVPLVQSVETSNFVWQALNRSQSVVWQMVADQAHQAEERFRSIIETSHSGVLITDDAFHLTYVNEELEQISGYTREELLGVDFRQLLDKESRQIVADRYVRRQRGEDISPRYEVAFLRKDGTKRYIEMSAVSLKDLKGKPYTVAQVLDVSERRQVEAALRENESKLRAIYEGSNDAVMLLDANGFFDCNPRTLEMFGFKTKQEFTAVHPADVSPPFQPDGQDSLAGAQERIQTAYRQGYHRFEWIHRRVNGEDFPAEVLLSAFEYGGKQVLQATVRDITERKQLELQIRESLARRSIQVQTSIEVAQHIAAAPELEELSHRVVTLIKERFNYYHVQLFRYVPAEDAVKLITGYGEIGQKMLAAGHKLAMGHGVVGTAAATGQSILAADVTRDRDWRPNPNLPDTQGELAVPIKMGGGDAESQLNALKYFAQGDFDGIAITAIDPEAVAHIARESLQRGKPVVAVSTDLGQDNQSALVFAVEHELGYLLGVQAGTWAKQHVPGDQNVKLGMLNYRTLPQVMQREIGIIDGIQSVIGERVTIVVSGSAVESKEAAYLTEGWLRDHPDLNMIVAINDATALGAYQAAQVMGWHDPDRFFIGGIDAVPEALAAIQQGGVYQATVNQPPEIMGIMAVRTLVAAIKGVPVKPAYTLYCAPVNRSNVAQFSGPSRKEALFAQQDIIPAESLSGLEVSGLRLGLSVLTLANPFFATLVESAQQEAQRLGVQLMVNDPSHVLGVLDVQSDQTNTLTDDDRLLLEGLCGQIASAMESTRLLEQLRRNEAQLSEALKIAKLGYWEYDVENDLFLFNDQFYSIFHTTVERAGGYQLSSAQYAQQFVHPDDLPMVGTEIEKALNSTDRHYNRQLEHRILYADGGVGYISVNVNIDRDEQGRILRYYGANQDITERKQAQEDLLRRNNQLTAFNRLGQSLAQLLTVEEVVKRVFQTVGEVFDNRNFYIALYDQRKQEISFPIYTLDGERRAVTGRPFGSGMTEYILRTRQPLLISRDVQNFAAGLGITNIGRPSQCYLGVPVLSGDTPLGVMAVQDYDHENVYSEADVELLNAMASRLAAALENVRLYSVESQRALQLQTASEVSRAASSILNAEELLPQAVELIRARFGFYYVGIFLTDETKRWAVLQAGTGSAGQQMLANKHHLEIGGNSMVGQCILTRRAQIALDVGEEAVHFDNPLLPLTHSEIALPLTSRGRIIGAMTIQSDQPAAFTVDDITVLQSMADQIANAVENARLYEQAQTALADTDNLLRANAELNISQSYDDVLAVLREHTTLGRDALSIAINVFDRPWTVHQTPQWIELIGYSTRRATGMELGSRFPLAVFASAHTLLRADAPTVLEDLTAPEVDPGTRALLVQRLGGKSAIFVPLVVGGQWVGYITVLFAEPTQFREAEVRRLEALVGQAAVAVQSMRNLAGAQQTLTETDALYRATQAIGRAQSTESILEAATPVVQLLGMTQAVLRMITRRDLNGVIAANDCYAYHRLEDQWVLQPILKDVPVNDFAALRPLLRNPEEVMIYKDAQNPESFMPDVVRQTLMASGLQSAVATSITIQGEVMGFLVFSGPQALTETAEQRIRLTVRTLSDQMAVALQNRQLFEQTRAALEEVDAINRRLTGEAWESYLRQQAGREVIWATDDEVAAPETLSQLDDQLAAGEITLEADPENAAEGTVTAPILLRGQPIGALRLRTPLSEWNDDTEALLTDVAGHIAQAVENARLVEQTQRTAQRERMINEINARVRQSVDLEAILRTAVNELGQSLKAARVVARVGTTAAEGMPATGDGRGKTND